MNPDGRTNLALYYHYPTNNQMREIDSNFFKIFHETVPDYLTGKGVKHLSRSCCRCSSVTQIKTLPDLVRAISSAPDRDKKFGTILISAHAGQGGLALPLQEGDRGWLSFRTLNTALNSVLIGLGKDCPAGWNENDWRQLKPKIEKLKREFDLVPKRRFDKNTLIRLWCCNMGNNRETMEIFGKLFINRGESIGIEAPTRITSGMYHVLPKAKSPADYTRWYKKSVQLNHIYPEITKLVEKDSDGNVLTGDSLSEAQGDFYKTVLDNCTIEGNPNCFPYLGICLENRRCTNNNFIPPGKNNFPSFWNSIVVTR